MKREVLMLEAEAAQLAFEVLLLPDLLNSPGITPTADSHRTLRDANGVWSLAKHYRIVTRRAISLDATRAGATERILVLDLR